MHYGTCGPGAASRPAVDRTQRRVGATDDHVAPGSVVVRKDAIDLRQSTLMTPTRDADEGRRSLLGEHFGADFASVPCSHSPCARRAHRATKTGRVVRKVEHLAWHGCCKTRDMTAISRVFAAVLIALGLACALPASGVNAQSLVHPPAHPAEPASYRLASLRSLNSITELDARDAVLTRRLRGYGLGMVGSVALIVGGLFLAAEYSPLFCSDCERGFRPGVGGLGMAVMSLGGLWLFAGVPSLITSGARRQTARRRIGALTMTPVASFSSQGNTGGATLQLTW